MSEKHSLSLDVHSLTRKLNRRSPLFSAETVPFKLFNGPSTAVIRFFPSTIGNVPIKTAYGAMCGEKNCCWIIYAHFKRLSGPRWALIVSFSRVFFFLLFKVFNCRGLTCSAGGPEWSDPERFCHWGKRCSRTCPAGVWRRFPRPVTAWQRGRLYLDPRSLQSSPGIWKGLSRANKRRPHFRILESGWVTHSEWLSKQANSQLITDQFSKYL